MALTGGALSSPNTGLQLQAARSSEIISLEKISRSRNCGPGRSAAPKSRHNRTDYLETTTTGQVSSHATLKISTREVGNKWSLRKKDRLLNWACKRPFPGKTKREVGFFGKNLSKKRWGGRGRASKAKNVGGGREKTLSTQSPLP